jgi:hypothetical protein
VVLGLTQPRREVTSRKYFWGVERGRGVRLTTSPPSVSQDQVMLLPTVSRPVRLGVRPSSVTHDQIFITVGNLRPSCCVAPSLTRGRFCNLLVQFAVTLGPKSRRTHNRILLSHLRLSQPGGSGPRICIPQEQGGPVIPSGTGFPFCRLLRLPGLWWRYSNPPPHGLSVIRLSRHCDILNNSQP